MSTKRLPEEGGFIRYLFLKAYVSFREGTGMGKKMIILSFLGLLLSLLYAIFLYLLT